MLYLYTGTDREKARSALGADLAKEARGARLVRVTDANSRADLAGALGGAGMFAEQRVVVLAGILGNPEMRDMLMNRLAEIAASAEPFFVLEEKPDAEARRVLEKLAARKVRFDAKAKPREGGVFGLARSLAGGKRALWLALQREFAGGAAPEALHGVLFWGAKEAFMKSRAGAERDRAARLVARLAELPHEARRRGEDLEYALERFALSEA